MRQNGSPSGVARQVVLDNSGEPSVKSKQQSYSTLTNALEVSMSRITCQLAKLALVMLLAGQLLPSHPLPSFSCGLMTPTGLCPSLQNTGIPAENLDAPDVETPKNERLSTLKISWPCDTSDSSPSAWSPALLQECKDLCESRDRVSAA